jgi:hypothetical protein
MFSPRAKRETAPAKPVRAENLVHGSDQQGCGLGGQP